MAMNDYSKQIHNQSAEIGRDLLEKLVFHKDTFVPDITEDPEAKQKLMEATLDLGTEVMGYLATKNIPARYATMAIDKMIEGLTGLKQYVDGTLNSYEDEYLSRMYGIKNAEGKYRREEATVADLVLNLEKAKELTGNQRGDFFNDTAPTLPVSEDTPAPVETTTDGSISSPFVPGAEGEAPSVSE